MLARRKRIADIYCKGLQRLPIQLPIYGEGDVIQEFIVRIGNDEERQRFKKHMDKWGVELLIRDTTPYNKVKNLFLDKFDLPTTESISKDACRLPAYPELTDKEVKYIIKAIRNFYEMDNGTRV